MISISGVQQGPSEITGRWTPDERCFGDIPCFVANWIDANTASDIERLLLLRSDAERAELKQRLAADPQAVGRNAARFKTTRRWMLLGWMDYGEFRIALLSKQDEFGETTAYTLPLRRTGSRWNQTDALVSDPGVFAIINRVADAVLQRRIKK